MQPPLVAKSRSSKSIKSASARSKKLLRKLKLKRPFQRRLRCKKLTLFPSNQLPLPHLRSKALRLLASPVTWPSQRWVKQRAKSSSMSKSERNKSVRL